MLAWNWSPATSSARASSSAAKPVALSVFLAASSRSSATQGERATVPTRDASDLRAIEIAAPHFTARSSRPGTFGRSTVVRPATTPSAQRIESSRNAAGPNCTSTTPSSSAWAGLSVRLFFSGFSSTTLSAFSMPMRFGSSHAPPQAGTMPRNTSGRAMAAADESTVR
jgi:hypothetical protein